MPIEIKELFIKAVIDTGSGQPGASGPASNATGQPDEQLISLCVEKVLEILKEKTER